MTAVQLCHRRGRRRSSSSSAIAINGSFRSAILGDVTSLATAVAGLASSVEGAAIGSGTVARDVSQLAAGIALHGLRLAVTSIVVRSSALVASRWTSTSSKSTTESSIPATRNASSTARARVGVGARAGKMARLSAVVAASTDTSTAQTEGRTIGLNVAQALAVITLFRLGRARMGAGVRFMALRDR